MPNRTEAALRKQRLRMPPGDYRYCACSRLYSLRGFERKRLITTPIQLRASQGSADRTGTLHLL